MGIFELRRGRVPSAELDEGELVRRMQSEDRRALEEIFHRYKDRIFSLCLRMTADRHTAEDLTQDAFITMSSKIRTFRGDSKFSSWFHRLTSNLVIDHLRRHRRLVFSDAQDESESSLLESLPGQRTEPKPLEGIELRRALDQLPEGYRLVFVLFEVEQWSHEEIAETLGCSVNTSKTQLFKARKRLRELLA